MDKIKQYGDGLWSYSFLKNFKVSPLQARAYLLREEKPPTPALIFGRLFHSVMADQVDEEFIIYNELDRPEQDKSMASKANKSWKMEFYEDGRTVVSEDDHALALQMRQAVEMHPFGKKLLEWSGVNEQVFENNKYRCRADKVIHDKQLIIDWKSTQRVVPEAIQYDMKKYSYHAQAALYNHIIGDDYSFMLVFVEKQEPFDVLPVLIEPDSEWMAEGSDLINKWSSDAEECFRTGEWPGVSGMFPNNVLSI